jgi:predicted dehydrogenase
MAHGIGIIGLGIMGQRMLASLGHHRGFTVIAAWDQSADALDRLRRDKPTIAAEASAESLAKRADLAALYIASPPVSHPAYVELAWDNSKAAFCEKPLAVSLAASERLVRRQSAEHQRAAINFPFASAPAARTLTAAVAEGSLGAVERIDIAVAFAAWPRPWQQAGAWLAQREEGGFVREVISHFIFLSQRLAGPLAVGGARVTYPADGKTAETAIEAHLTAGKIEIGLTGKVGETRADDSNSLTVTGTKGAMRLYDWAGLQRREHGGWREVEFGPGPPLRQRSAETQLDQLAALIEGRLHGLPTLEEGLAVQRCVETLLKSGG